MEVDRRRRVFEGTNWSLRRDSRRLHTTSTREIRRRTDSRSSRLGSNKLTTAKDVRQGLLHFLDRDLIGPAHGDEEVLEDQPRNRYLAGVLFPQESTRNDSESAGGVEESSNDVEVPDSDILVDLEDESIESDSILRKATSDVSLELESEHDDTLTLANSFRPSAMGLSFCVNGDDCTLRVEIMAAEYASRPDEEDGFRKMKYIRKPIRPPAVYICLREARTSPVYDRFIVPGLRLKGVFRRQTNGQILTTLSVYNTSRVTERNSHTFYQVGLRVCSRESQPIFVEYRTPFTRPEDSEEASLALLYRRRKEYAVGHGCAAAWGEVESAGTREVYTTVLPNVVVPPVNAKSHESPYLDMEFLQGGCGTPRVDIPNALALFCDDYEAWIAEREVEARFLDEYEPAPSDHLILARTALKRMRSGIDLLRSDGKALNAFMLANRVMLMQQYHASLRRRLSDQWRPLPSDASSYESDWEQQRGYWRTFQIGFIIMNLVGLSSGNATVSVNGDDVVERDLVDLIWFPTGGGKTEAYLGLAAYLIFRRRLDGEEERGCKVLMRYTLRVLTSQQFQRAASLICACEIVRREAPAVYGNEPISVGLYVGRSLTPNKEKDALSAVARMARKGKDEKNPFQLLHCPWCGTELNNEERLGYTERRRRMIFQCPSHGLDEGDACPFSKRSSHLPICVVDESIYKNPPTLLIATVDKLAMFAWLGESASILKSGGGPELIIQDELHLISGPLGSMVGLYEGVFEYLSSLNGSKPKIVASTATIRRAADQCRALYDRPVFQFPPSGLDASDSFFSREDPDTPGRLYLGFLPTAASSPLTAQIRSIVALQQGVLIVADDHTNDEAIDPYWTLVQYFGSLKELGHAATFVTADIPEFLPTMHRRFDVPRERRRWMRSSDELTSRKNEDEIPQILERLETRYQFGAGTHEQALDTLLATNMISVGVDIERLGLMLVVTQPKGTSEYIQASSRVGRSTDGPGLVFTLYNAARPRDRSHYEHFTSYHEGYYRFVEPTSVTPFSPPALQRALHAVLVIAGRHVAGWDTPKDATFDDPEFQKFLSFMRSRVRSIDLDHLIEFDALVQDRLRDWESRRVDKWGDFDESSEDPVLMRPAGRPARDHDRSSWETPTSMRNVDVECVATVIPRFPHKDLGSA